MSINGLLNQARMIRRDAGNLIDSTQQGAAKSEHEALQAPATLDHLIRTGTDPSQVAAFLDGAQVRAEAAKKRGADLEAMAKRVDTAITALSKAVNPNDTSDDQQKLQGELARCMGIRGALGSAIYDATTEAGIAAAIAGKSESGLIIGAKAALIIPERPKLILPNAA